MRAKREAGRYFYEAKGRWYRYWWDPGSHKSYRQLESRWVWEREYGPIPDGYEVHHGDGDKTNNALDNLQLLTAEEHRAFHTRLGRNHHEIVDGIEHKRCPQCEDCKPLDCFGTRSDGRPRAYCIVCQQKYDRDHYAKNKKRVKARSRRWRAENREHIKAYNRAYRARKRAIREAAKEASVVVS